jgi:hypothetical protein
MVFEDTISQLGGWMKEERIVIVVMSSEGTQLFSYVFVYLLNLSVVPQSSNPLRHEGVVIWHAPSKACCKGNFEREPPHHLIPPVL